MAQNARLALIPALINHICTVFGSIRIPYSNIRYSTRYRYSIGYSIGSKAILSSITEYSVGRRDRIFEYLPFSCFSNTPIPEKVRFWTYLYEIYPKITFLFGFFLLFSGPGRLFFGANIRIFGIRPTADPAEYPNTPADDFFNYSNSGIRILPNTVFAAYFHTFSSMNSIGLELNLK